MGYEGRKSVEERCGEEQEGRIVCLIVADESQEDV